MKSKYIFTMFSIFLLITSSVSVAGSFHNPDNVPSNDIENTEDENSNIEFAPDLGSAFSTFDRIDRNQDLGEIILVNVERYEPTTISSDYFRNRDFPVIVHLTGRTLESSLFGSQSADSLETIFGDLKIRDVRIIRQTLSRYVSGVQEVPPEGGYRVRPDGTVDLGYLRLYLRRQPIEDKVPDIINLNLTARINFDIDSGFGVFGKQDLFFGSDRSDIKKFWEGRGELEFISVSVNKAKFQLYDGNGNTLGGPFDLTINGKPKTFTLRDGPIFLDNRIRLKLTHLSGDKDIAKFRVGTEDVDAVKGMNLFPGSQWVVDKIGSPLVTLKNQETGRELTFNSSRSIGNYKSGYCDNVNPLTHGELVSYQTANYLDKTLSSLEKVSKGEKLSEDEFFINIFQELIQEDVSNIFTTAEPGATKVDISFDEFYDEVGEKSISQGEIDERKFYCSALREYEKALEFATGEERDKLNADIGDIYYKIGETKTAVGFYSDIKKDSEVYTSRSIEPKLRSVQSDLESDRTSYEFIEGRRVYLKDIVSPKDGSFVANVNGEDRTFGKGSDLISGIYNKQPFVWRVFSVRPGSVDVVMVGNNVPRNRKVTLREGSSEFLEIESDEGVQNRNIQVIVKRIDSPVSAVVSVLPGDGRNYGVSHFQLHLPIEKSLIQWTPEQIDKKIDSARKTISKLDKITDRLSKFITTLKVACFSVFSYLAVKNAFFVNNQGRREVVQDYTSDICPRLKEEGKYKSISECVEGESETIDKLSKIRSAAIENRDKLMNGFNPNDPGDVRKVYLQLGGEDLGISEGFFREAVSGEYSGYTGLTSSRLDELVLLSYSDPEKLTEEFSRFKKEGTFSKLGNAIEKVKGISDTELKRVIINSQFTKGYGTRTSIDNLEGTNVKELLEGKKYDTNNILLVSNVFPLDGGFYQVWTGSESVIAKAILINNIPQQINGRPIYTNKDSNDGDSDKTIYYDLTGNEGSLCSTSYAPGQEKRNHYDDENRLWVFDYRGNKNAFNHAGKPNYVLVDYQDDGSRKYFVYNAGPNCVIDLGKTHTDDRLILHSNVLEDVRADRNEKILYDYARVKNDIDRAFKDRDRYGFRGNNERTPDGITQSNALFDSQYEPSSECSSRMSQSDCDLLFGFCDPVLCPASRFNLGGRWKVDNVIQSGLIGSIVLGLPNFGPKEPLPICLTGVNAGLENIQSKFEGYEDCLQRAKATGESVGICNTIRSVYMCEILWRESLSIFGTLGKLGDVVSERIFGSSKGGGEYINWKQSWSHLTDSVSFFTTTYATSAFASYKARNLGEFGSQICKAAIYGKNPGGGDFIGSLLEPTSPFQYTGWFDELEYTGIEGGQSVYRIYYHIFAGRDDNNINYYVYLKGPGLRPFIVTNPESGSAYGYIKKGDFVDRSWTVNGRSGYTQMCININNRENCGFGKVSSEFSLNFLNDLIVEDELGRKIDSAEECSPDNPRLSPSLQSLTTPSNFGLVETGIVRVCSTFDPDAGGTRWQEIGTCGVDENGISQGICYIDQNSYNLNEAKDRRAVIAELNEDFVNNISTTFFNQGNEIVVRTLDSLESESDKNIRNKNFNALVSNAISYFTLIANGMDDGGPLETRARARLGDVYKVLGDLTNINLASIKSQKFKRIIEEFSKIKTESFFEGKEINIIDDRKFLQAIGRDGLDKVRSWDGNEWFFGLDRMTQNYVTEENFEKGLKYAYDGVRSARSQIDHSKLNPVKIECGGSKYDVPEVENVESGTFDLVDFETFRNLLLEKCVLDYIDVVEIKDFFDIVSFASIEGVSNGEVSIRCAPDNPEDLVKYTNWIEKYSNEYGVDPILALAVMMQESWCDQTPRNSGSGAEGLMQITDKNNKGTFTEVCKNKIPGLDLDRFDDVKGEENAENNIACGIKILKTKYTQLKNTERAYSCAAYGSQPEIYEEYSGWKAALRGYNGYSCAGPNVDADQTYVEKIWDNIYSTLKVGVDKTEGDILVGERCDTKSASDARFCSVVPNCYVKAPEWWDLFGKNTCEDCKDLNNCGEIKDPEKCVQKECNEKSGLTCKWIVSSKECVNS